MRITITFYAIHYWLVFKPFISHLSIYILTGKSMSTSQHFPPTLPTYKLLRLSLDQRLDSALCKIPFHGVQTIPDTDILAYLCSCYGSGQLTSCFSFSLCKLFNKCLFLGVIFCMWAPFLLTQCTQ